MALSLAACGADDATSSKPTGCGSGQEVKVNLLYPTQPVTLDANYDTIVAFSQITRNMYDGLFKLDEDANVVPSLASEYTQPDEKTYDLTLRDDVTFHDGSKFTSKDVVSSITRIQSDAALASKQSTYLSNVASVTADGDYKVRIELTQPDASFLKTLATVVYITPEEAVKKAGTEFGENPVGSGPFQFVKWNQGDSVDMKANCDYWGEKAIPSTVEFRFISEPATQLSSLESGEIDIATAVSPDLAAGLDGSSTVSVESAPGNQSFWFTLNTLEGPMADERVRQALNYAVDKDAITDALLGGFAKPIGQPYASTVFGSTESVEPYAYDPDQAKSLLDDAGYADGLEIELVTDQEVLKDVQQVVASDLQKVGISVKTKFDSNFFSDTWLAEKMAPNQMYLNSNTNLLMDADFPLGLHFDGARRGLYFHTPETDTAIAEARGIADEAERQTAYDSLNAQLHDLAPAIFLYSPDAIYGVSTEVDWKPRPDGAIYLAGAAK